MTRPHVLAALGAVFLLGACDTQRSPPPARGAGSVPMGTTPSGQSAVTPEASGPGGINRGLYQGADPNFPRGTAGGSRSN